MAARPGQGMEPGAPGAEPTNWGSAFGGPAWEYDEATGEYYLHLFSRKQPDLNWENPEVREAIYEMMRWWLDRGVDGFRMDVINYISKDPALPDGEQSMGAAYGNGATAYLNGPRIHEFLHEMHERVFAGRDGLLTVGEMPGVTVDAGRSCYTDPAREEVDMVFQFDHVWADRGPDPWIAAAVAAHQPQGHLRPVAGRAGRDRLEQSLLEQPRPAARGVPLRRRRRASGWSRPRCSARCCTCTAARRTSIRAKSSA